MIYVWHRMHCKGEKKYNHQCSRCKYSAFPMNGTLFHKVEFLILKAFYILYYVNINKKGISFMELRRKLSLYQKTCWLFKHKVMLGMVEVDETALKTNFKSLTHVPSKKTGENLSYLHRAIIDFNGWHKGIQYVVHLQAYVYEYTYRLIRIFLSKGSFYNLLSKMVTIEPCFYKMIIN